MWPPLSSLTCLVSLWKKSHSNCVIAKRFLWDRKIPLIGIQLWWRYRNVGIFLQVFLYLFFWGGFRSDGEHWVWQWNTTFKKFHNKNRCFAYCLEENKKLSIHKSWTWYPSFIIYFINPEGKCKCSCTLYYTDRPEIHTCTRAQIRPIHVHWWRCQSQEAANGLTPWSSWYNTRWGWFP